VVEQSKKTHMLTAFLDRLDEEATNGYKNNVGKRGIIGIVKDYSEYLPEETHTALAYYDSWTAQEREKAVIAARCSVLSQIGVGSANTPSMNHRHHGGVDLHPDPTISSCMAGEQGRPNALTPSNLCGVTRESSEDTLSNPHGPMRPNNGHALRFGDFKGRTLQRVFDNDPLYLLAYLESTVCDHTERSLVQAFLFPPRWNIERTEEPGMQGRPSALTSSEAWSVRDMNESVLRLQIMPYHEYLHTAHWQGVRRAALARADHRCQLCNSPTALQVHHRTYERRGNERDNDVIALCDTCHSIFHETHPDFTRRSGSIVAATLLASPTFCVPAAQQDGSRTNTYDAKIVPEWLGVTPLPRMSTEPVAAKSRRYRVKARKRTAVSRDDFRKWALSLAAVAALVFGPLGYNRAKEAGDARATASVVALENSDASSTAYAMASAIAGEQYANRLATERASKVISPLPTPVAQATPRYLPGAVMSDSWVAYSPEVGVRFFAPQSVIEMPDSHAANAYYLRSPSAFGSGGYEALEIHRLQGQNSGDVPGTWKAQNDAFLTVIEAKDYSVTLGPSPQRIGNYLGQRGQFNYTQSNNDQRISGTMWVGQVDSDIVVIVYRCETEREYWLDRGMTQIMDTIDFNAR